jgi:FkbM family methyltransferase
MNNLHKITLEAINHLIQNDEVIAKASQELAFGQAGIKSNDIGILVKLYRNLFDKSKSQFKQDIFALLELNFKKNGYFVEFGASHGGEGSNTWLLEKEFGWQGILAEPSKCFQQELRANRSVHIEEKCVWSSSNELLLFNEVTLPGLSGLSTIDSFSNSDGHAHLRNTGKKYSVDTISLTDLLDKYEAPNIIDYLSIDTEGTEFE